MKIISFLRVPVLMLILANPEFAASGNPSPDTPPDFEDISVLVAKGRARYLAGDPAGADEVFHRVVTAEPGNRDANQFLERIQRERTIADAHERERSRGQLLDEVGRG